MWGEAYAWYGMGWMHEWSGRSPEAREAHREAMARFVASDNPHGEIEVLCSLGAIERRAGGLVAAQGYLERACRLAGQMGDSQSELMATLELGRLHQFTGELTLSAEFLRASLAAAQKFGDPDMAANIRLFLADTLHPVGAGHRGRGAAAARRGSSSRSTTTGRAASGCGA